MIETVTIANCKRWPFLLKENVQSYGRADINKIIKCAHFQRLGVISNFFCIKSHYLTHHYLIFPIIQQPSQSKFECFTSLFGCFLHQHDTNIFNLPRHDIRQKGDIGWITLTTNVKTLCFTWWHFGWTFSHLDQDTQQMFSHLQCWSPAPG